MKRSLCLIMVLTLMLSAIPALAFEELAKGSKGDAVVELQNKLNELGYSVGTADGDYGGKTIRAIAEFQINNGLSMTGVANAETQDIVFSSNAKEKSKNLDKNRIIEEFTAVAEAMGMNVVSTDYTTNKNPDYIGIVCNRTNDNILQLMFYVGIGTQLFTASIMDVNSDMVAYFCTLMYKYSDCFDMLYCDNLNDLMKGIDNSIFYKSSLNGASYYKEEELINFLFDFTELAKEYLPSPILNITTSIKPTVGEETTSASNDLPSSNKSFEQLDIVDMSPCNGTGLLILTNDSVLWELDENPSYGETIWILRVVDTEVEKICYNQYGAYIKKDGTAKSVNSYVAEEIGWNEGDWSDITLLAVGNNHAVGLKYDGSWVSTGEYIDGQRDIDGWEDIVSIDVGSNHTVGLKSDGTVVATGDNSKGQCNVSSWTDIVKISVGYNTTIGLKSDGTVVATGTNKEGECNVQNWKNVIDIANVYDGAVGLTADGELLTTSRKFAKDEYYRTIPYKYRVENATGIRGGTDLLLVTKQDDTIELFGAEYIKSNGNPILYCSKLMDIVNNSLLNIATPKYPSALEVEDVEATAKVSNKPNPQPVVAETKKEYSENECKEIALAYMKEHIHSYLKNPASLQIVSVTGGKTEGSEYLFVINYTAMNSFGGYTPGNYYCTVDYITGEVTMGGTI